MSGPEPARLAAHLERLVLLLVHPRGQFQEADERPLSWTQRLALAVAVDESPLRLGALAARMGTTDATASRTVDSLASIGLLRREPDDSDGPRRPRPPHPRGSDPACRAAATARRCACEWPFAYARGG
ncbi:MULTISPECIES: MarR family transcriptional regulator [unclassified Nocardioides]|uniref:MarR family transcriptional regulator n=1 Tax=Nocardioides sp. (strain ATCC BAA-499 / JS614) TaxID=196162 RepID=UPI000A067EC5